MYRKIDCGDYKASKRHRSKIAILMVSTTIWSGPMGESV